MYYCSIHSFEYECPLCEEKETNEFEWKFRSTLRGKGWELLSEYTFPKSPVTVQCENHHVFSVVPIQSRTKCSWCTKKPFHKTAKKLFDFLSELDIPFYCEYTFPWTKKNYRYDFVCINKKIILELDGDHHFEQVRDYDPPEKILQLDVCKMYYAINRGYTIIRVYQPDVFHDTISWMPLLHYYLTRPQEGNQKVYTISKDPSKYNKHNELLFKIQNAV